MSHLVTACNTSDRSGPGYCLHPWLRVCPEIWMEVTPTTFKHVLTIQCMNIRIKMLFTWKMISPASISLAATSIRPHLSSKWML